MYTNNSFCTLFVCFVLLALAAHAAPRYWDMSKYVRPNTGSEGWFDNCGEMGQVTEKGFQFQIGKKYQSLWYIEKGGIDTKKYTHLEIHQQSQTTILFSILVYGAGEGGYDKSRQLSGSWSSNSRYYPEIKSLDLSQIPRYKQGNIEKLLFTVSNSGEGNEGLISKIALRRGRDRFRNGSLLQTDAKGLPEFWNISAPASLQPEGVNGLPAMAVKGGNASTRLDWLCPGVNYRASIYLKNAKSAQVVIVSRDGKEKRVFPMKPEGGEWEFACFQCRYTVPDFAFSGRLEVEFNDEGAFSDAMLEEIGESVSYHASWIWSQEPASHNQDCIFRRDIEIKNPAELASAFLQGTCDDALEMTVNGTRVFGNTIWASPEYKEILPLLKAGRNRLLAKCHNDTSAAGLLAELKLVYKDGHVETIGTDEEWQYVGQTTLPADESSWKPAKSLGAYPSRPWGKMVKYFQGASEETALVPIDKEGYLKHKTHAKINRELNYPRMEINGEIAEPVIFGIRWRGERRESYRTARESGFKLFRMMWEFSFEALQKDGSIDYSTLEEALEEFAREIPDGKIILVMRLTPASWWTAEHPDELVKFADGTSTGGDGVFASPASKYWRNYINGKFGEALRHIESSWYGSLIAGYMPCNMRGPEWVFTYKNNCYPDYSIPMRDHFREYLAEKYGNDVDRLRKAWRNETVTFANAEIPPQPQRQRESGFFLQDDRQDVMDYTRAMNRAVVDTIISVMDTVSQNAPDKLKVLYYGYLMTLAHISMSPGAGGHYDLMRLVEANKVDVFASPVSYVWRKPGDISGVGSVESTFRKHGVVWLQEADNRTFLTREGDDHANTRNPEDSLAENLREYAYALCRREPVWFYELGGGWYDNPCFQQDFKKMRELYNEQQKKNVTWQPEVAMFFDEKFVDGIVLNDNRWGHNRPYNLAAEAQKSLALASVPYDLFELEDIFSLDLSTYKVLYFQNAWRKNERLAKLLEEKVYAAGKTAIFLYAPGYGQHGGLEGMKALTKMTFRLLPFGAPLFYMDNASRPIGERACLDTEVFAVTDADVEVLGRYPNGGVAAARKKVSNGASVILPTFDSTGVTMQNLLRNAGCTPFLDTRDRVVFDGEYLAIVACDAPGPRHVTLPVKAKQLVDFASSCVYDAESVMGAPNQQRHFTIDMKPGDTALLKLITP